MANDTIAVPIPTHAVQQYMATLDERGECYAFNVRAWAPGRAGRLVLNRDGVDDALEIFLNMNGTWSAQHVIVIGD